VRFQDKVVVITGGSSGIGLAAAREFAREGAQLA
jgi:3-hydroxybutyrate dehydrogenase